MAFCQSDQHKLTLEYSRGVVTTDRVLVARALAVSEGLVLPVVIVVTAEVVMLVGVEVSVELLVVL